MPRSLEQSHQSVCGIFVALVKTFLRARHFKYVYINCIKLCLSLCHKRSRTRTCLQLPMHFLQLSEIEQRLRQISWALKALMQELMQDSRQIMLQCPKFPLLSQSWEVRNPVKVGSCNLSLPSSHHKCSYPKVRTNRVQSNHCGKWLPALAKPGPTIREAFQYGYRLLRLQSDPACEPPAESMSSMSHGTRPPGISSLTEANEPLRAAASVYRNHRKLQSVFSFPDVSWCFLAFLMLKFLSCRFHLCLPAEVLGDTWANHAGARTPSTHLHSCLIAQIKSSMNHYEPIYIIKLG